MHAGLRHLLLSGVNPVADLNFAGGVLQLGGARYSNPAEIPGWSFARASEGRSLDGVTNFASGAPRIVSGLGILIEEARTNLFLNSSAPATQNITITAANHTITVWGSGSVDVTAGTATISNGGTVTAGSPRTIGCTVGGTITVTVTGSPTYVQVELGSTGTSPIITAGSSVARAADDGVITGLVLPSAGTLIVEAQAYAFNSAASLIGGINPNVASLSNATPGTEAVSVSRGPSTNNTFFSVRSAGASVADVNPNAWANGATQRVAGRYATNDFSAAAAGTLGTPDTSGAQPTGMTRIHIGQGRTVGTGQWNCYIRRITVYDRLFTDGQLVGASA